MTTAYHARYFAHDLTRQSPSDGVDRLSMSLFDATVDLNPHQIEAALFALKSPLSKGVVLADEVGLGKTIEAGIVLCQFWAERKRRLLILCPASIRKQWALELQEKFNLPAIVLDSRAYREMQRSGVPRPLESGAIIIMSFHFANSLREELKAIPWRLVVIDEAHKLRNAYRPSNRIGQAIRWATEGCRKLLLTATPLQNSLLELYGISTLIDEHLFGDVTSFRSQYTTAGADLGELRSRLAGFCKRTLRNQVTEYVRYTERKPVTRPFSPTDDEHRLYEAVSAFLQRPDSYAIPHRQRHLTVLILRKLLASSSYAIAGTLETMKARLELMLEGAVSDVEFNERLIDSEEIEDELLEEFLSDPNDAPPEEPIPADHVEPQIDVEAIKREIAELNVLIQWARGVGVDTKTRTLLTSLGIGFDRMDEMGAPRKALIFTESRRTQDYLKSFLESNGFAGQVVAFNGTNSGPEAKAIYDRWVAENTDSGRSTGSRAIDVRTALIEHFRDHAQIMIATEAASEGVNLQFCSLVVNYDLPWNPQRIEQRIGRCHRYGQKHDVVVINFLNERNHADQRVYELLRDKFSLFNGVFGASDEVLGAIESGVDFEKRILAIYQDCRTSEAIEAAFRLLQQELDEHIRERMNDTRKILFEHFDEDVHQRLRLSLEDAKAQLDHFGKRFWTVTKHVLDDSADFDDQQLVFDLNRPPRSEIRSGRYHLISKSRPDDEDNASGHFLYRLSHPLGEHVIDTAKALDTPSAELRFDITNHPARIAVIESLKGRSGHLILQRLTIQSYEVEDYLLFSGFTDDGEALDQETCDKLFNCRAAAAQPIDISEAVNQRLAAESDRHIQATINRSLESNNEHFQRARERLDKWADDMVIAAEKALRDTKEQIKSLRRESRQAVTLQAQHEIQERMRQLERKQRRQRKEIFDVEDEIMSKRDDLIDGLERRLSQGSSAETLFTIRWSVV